MTFTLNLANSSSPKLPPVCAAIIFHSSLIILHFSLVFLPFSLFPYLQCYPECVMFRPNVTPYPENAVGACVRTARKSRDLLRVRPLRAPAFSGWCVPQGDRYMPRLHGRFSRSARRQRQGLKLFPRQPRYPRLTRLPRRVVFVVKNIHHSSFFILHYFFSVSCPSHLAPARYWSPKRRFFTAQSSRLHLPIKTVKLANCKTAITCKLMKQKCLTPYTNEITWRNVFIHAISVSPCLRLLRVLAPQAQEVIAL